MWDKARKKSKRFRLAKFLIGGIMTLLGCVFVFFWYVNHLHPYCADWEGSARTWIDENENGLFDVNEPLLENVALTIAHSESPANIVWKATTNKWGSAELSFPTSGDCSPNVITITTVTPIGYRPTTSVSQQTQACVAMSIWKKEILCSPGPFYFGFVQGSES